MKRFKSRLLKDGGLIVQDLLLWLLSMRIRQDFLKSIQFESTFMHMKNKIAEEYVLDFYSFLSSSATTMMISHVFFAAPIMASFL